MANNWLLCKVRPARMRRLIWNLLTFIIPWSRQPGDGKVFCALASATSPRERSKPLWQEVKCFIHLLKRISLHLSVNQMWKRSRKTSWQNDIIQEYKLHTVEKSNRNLEASKGTGTEISIHRRDVISGRFEPSEERRLEFNGGNIQTDVNSTIYSQN